MPCLIVGMILELLYFFLFLFDTEVGEEAVLLEFPLNYSLSG